MKDFFKIINWWVVLIIFVICRILDGIHPILFFIFAGGIMFWVIWDIVKDYKSGNSKE